jgi:uncharacterized protein (TIGR03435 family)
MRSAIVLLFSMLVCGPLRGQQVPEAVPAFAVATIKPSAPDTAILTQIRGNRFVTEGTTFGDLFKYAYSVHPDQLVGGPGWLRTAKFDVLADPEMEKRLNSEQMKSMVQQLLTDRFHLVMHREKNSLSVYALVKTTETPKLTKSEGNDRGIPVVGYSPKGELRAGNATLENFATFLQRFVLDRPAVDQTGIAGRFDLLLRWTPDNFRPGIQAGDAQDNAAAPPNLFTAIKEQLGLKLQPMKAEVEVFRVDQVAQPSEN